MTTAVSPSAEDSESDETPAAAEVAAKPTKRSLKKSKLKITMTDDATTPGKTTPLAKKRRASDPSAKPKFKRRRKVPPSSEVDSAPAAPSATGPPTDEIAPAEAVALYADAMDEGKVIAAKYRELKKQVRGEVTQYRDELSAALTDARQNRSIDSLSFPLPDGGAPHLTFKSNTTYPQVKRTSVETALRLVTPAAVVQIHETTPTKQLSQCVAEALLARIKYDLARVNTQPSWTKGPPAKSKVGNGAPVIQPAPPDLVEKYITLNTKLAELKTLVASQKTAMVKVEVVKAKNEAQARVYLAPLKYAQDTVTVTRVNTAGKPVRIDKHVLRLRKSPPRKLPAVKVKTLERALPLTQVTLVLPQGDVVDFSLDEVNSILADNREALMSAYDLVHAKYAFVNAIKARATAGKSVLRLGKARACKKTT